MEKSLLEQDRASEQVRCENNRLKEEQQKLNKKLASCEPMQEELEKLVQTTSFCLFICLSSLICQVKRTLFTIGRVNEETTIDSV